MLNNIKEIKLTKWPLMVILALILTDIIIVSNISPLKEIITFLYFTMVPGLLIIHMLKLDKTNFLNKLVLSIGLSVSVLIFAGLFLNSLYPYILKPLSFLPVFISINIITVILTVIAYIKNKNNLFIFDIFNLRINDENKLTSMLIYPAMLPFLSILGTYLMNTTQNNVLLLIMLFLIPIYIVLLFYFKDKIYSFNYPFAIGMISLSLLLMHGLTSYHLTGIDIHKEFYCFQLTLNTFHWDVSSYYDTFNACLSITVLPAVYQALSNINGEYIFKLFFPLIGSLTPLVFYVLFRNFMDKKYAFLAVLLFMFQAFFIGSLGSVRQVIAMFFFFLALLVIFDESISGLSKKFLFLVLMLSVVASHYSTAYLSFVLVVPILLIPFFKGLFSKKINFTNFDIIIIFFIFVLLWYKLVGQIQINAAQNVLNIAITTSGTGSTIGILPEGSRDSMVLAMLGIGLKSIPNIISAIIHDAVFFTIFIGLIALILEYKSLIKKLGSGYYIGIYISIAILISFIVIPSISINYGAERLFIQTLVFLAPVFVIGAQKMARIIKKPRADVIILITLLIMLFTCNTYLQYHFLGVHHSPYYEENGTIRNEYYIHDQEIKAGEWLKKNDITGKSKIYADTIAFQRVLLGYKNSTPNVFATFFVLNKTVNGSYIYLGYINVNKGFVYEKPNTVKNISEFNNLFIGKSRIYDNGGGQVLI